LDLSELSRFINAFSLRLPELLEAKTDMVVVFQVETQPLVVLRGKGEEGGSERRVAQLIDVFYGRCGG